jgi:predicted transcriptional regulator YdeE
MHLCYHRKNDQNIEVPIAFESSALQGEELNYTDVEKKAYAVFKSIKNFIPFLS